MAMEEYLQCEEMTAHFVLTAEQQRVFAQFDHLKPD